MHTIRRATADDAELIAQHRVLMFKDNDPDKVCTWEELHAAFLPWIAPRLADGSYVGWIAEEDGVATASAGVWFMDFLPHWMDPQPQRAYLTNFYTAPEARGRGIAKELVRLSVEEAKGRGVRAVTLHASKFGRPIYEKLGFTQNNEMLMRVEV